MSDAKRAWLSSMPLHISFDPHISFDRLSRPMMLYHDSISIPPFMVTFLMGAVGRKNLAYGTAANRRLATSTMPSDLSPRLLNIITVVVRVERWHEHVSRPTPGVLCLELGMVPIQFFWLVFGWYFLVFTEPIPEENLVGTFRY